MTAKALRLTIERLRQRIYELEDQMAQQARDLRGQVELNQALQDRLDRTRAEALGITDEDG